MSDNEEVNNKEKERRRSGPKARQVLHEGEKPFVESKRDRDWLRNAEKQRKHMAIQMEVQAKERQKRERRRQEREHRRRAREASSGSEPSVELIGGRNEKSAPKSAKNGVEKSKQKKKAEAPALPDEPTPKKERKEKKEKDEKKKDEKKKDEKKKEEKKKEEKKEKKEKTQKEADSDAGKKDKKEKKEKEEAAPPAKEEAKKDKKEKKEAAPKKKAEAETEPTKKAAAPKKAKKVVKGAKAAKAKVEETAAAAEEKEEEAPVDVEPDAAAAAAAAKKPKKKILSPRKKVIVKKKKKGGATAAAAGAAGADGGAAFKIVDFGSHEDLNAQYKKVNEDDHIELPDFHTDHAYFAVYDGHSGREVVDHVMKTLHDDLKEALATADSVEKAFTDAFLKCDANTKDLAGTSGTTAVCALFEKSASPPVLHVANVGDARALIGKSEAKAPVTRLTYDHKASDEAEKQRCTELGASFLWGRLQGVTMITRAIGDHDVKPYMIAEPYYTRTELGDSGNIVLLACDGIFDVMSDEEAMEIVRETDGDALTRAKRLVNVALEKGTKDNLTATVIMLE